MTYSNDATVNFSGGEVSSGILSRNDIPLYNKIVRRMENFIAEPLGPARYRPGSVLSHHTRGHNPAVFIEFQFSDQQSYLIEVTEGYFRFFKDNAVILDSTPHTITAISKANPASVTSNAHGRVAGEEVYIDDVVGMTEVNGKFFTIRSATTNAFTLEDEFGNAIDSTGYTTYVSGGTAAWVYEVQVPYQEEDLTEIKYTQNQDAMYLTHQSYQPRRLIRNAHDSWSFGRYARTNDPFQVVGEDTVVITGITQANPGVFTADNIFEVDDLVYLTVIVGMTELNKRLFRIRTANATTFTLEDKDTGVALDTSALTAYVSDGVAELVDAGSYPAAVGFTADSRLGYGNTTTNPDTLWYSRGPSSAGALRHTDHTTGSAASDALLFTLSPLQGRSDTIRWLANTDKYIAAGTFGSIRRVFGATEEASIATDEINAKSANSDGVSKASPVVDGATLFYINRAGLSVESIEYNYEVNGYAPDDKNLVTEHITVTGLKQLARQVGRPTLIWAVRNDGVLLALTYNAKENILGWHRHTIAGDGVVEWIGVMPRENNQDQLWMIVQREINGQTVRHIEYLSDPPVLPDELDFYTGLDAVGSADRERYENYLWEMAKHAIHLDCSLTYDGSVYGTDASASITMGEGAEDEDTEDVTVTASAAVFTSSMVGREIWGKYTTEGIGGGRLEITEYVSTTVVKGTILDTFPATATYDAGDWFLTATTLDGLDHLEGESVGIIADGAVPPDVVVTDGAIEIDEPASVIHVGLRYRGVIKTLPLDHGGRTGPALNKPKIVNHVGIRFVNSGGVQFGTSLYSLSEITFRTGNDFVGRAAPLFSGLEHVWYEDSTEQDKSIVLIQEQPLPCIVSCLDIYTETTD